jgi:hypothetical protein
MTTETQAGECAGIFRTILSTKFSLTSVERKVRANMAYTSIDFKTKTGLKKAVEIGMPVYIYNPGLGGDLSHFTGRKSIEGPHYPKAHTWYADVDVVDGLVTKVR